MYQPLLINMNIIKQASLSYLGGSEAWRFVGLEDWRLWTCRLGGLEGFMLRGLHRLGGSEASPFVGLEALDL